MKDSKAKSINALMKHLRSDKGINISGSKGKNDLRNIGYYHGYKGYRFYNKSAVKIPYSDFAEIKAVYDFDMKLKAWFYPLIMTLETALKNRVLEYTIEYANSADFVTIFNDVLNSYKDYPVNSREYKDKLRDKLALRQVIYNDIAKSVNSSDMVQHFYYNDKPVPIWAIFELITLGEFGNFYRAISRDVKLQICDSLGINRGYNTSGDILTTIIFAIKSLRNAIAHNKPIFDVRFKEQKLPLTFFSYLEQELNLPKPNPYYSNTTVIKFEQVIDYCLLVIFLLKKFGTARTELRQYIRNFETLYDSLKAKVNSNIYSTIVPIDISNKVLFLKNWV